MKPPIADPFGAPMGDLSERIFRLDFWRSLVIYLCVFAVVLPPIMSPALSSTLTRRISIDPLLVGVSVVVVVSLLSAGANLLYGIKVDRKNLQGFNFSWTAKREVQWDEMTHVRYGWSLYPYAIVSTAKRRNAVWLPLILSDKPGFMRAVEEFAPADNPLRLFLQKRGF